jgi:hypothetical protein
MLRHLQFEAASSFANPAQNSADGRKILLLQGYSTMPMLPNGTYDAIVVEAEEVADADIRLELAITLGPHIGRVIALRGRHVDTKRRPTTLPLDPIQLLGIPGTLIVRNGEPTFRPEFA